MSFPLLGRLRAAVVAAFALSWGLLASASVPLYTETLSQVESASRAAEDKLSAGKPVDVDLFTGSTTGDFHTAEDLPDGLIVFEGVKRVIFEPSGAIPNDSINDIRAEPTSNGPAKFLIVMSIDSVDAVGKRTEVEVRVHADSMALEDVRKPGERITQ